jgi:Holliday junction resolvase
MNQSFSEYVLYEPTLRILTAQGFTVQCECPCPGFDRAQGGDFKRIDFVASGNDVHFALEMKWARTNRPAIAEDVRKLRRFIEINSTASAFLCVFGKKSSLEQLRLAVPQLHEHGAPVYAEFGVTRYGCRMYKLGNP